MTLDSSMTLIEQALLARLEELFPDQGNRRNGGSRRPTTGRRPQPGQLGQLAQRAAPSVHNLWQLFNARRPEKMPKYMDNPDYCRAYLASFLLPNLAKIVQLLTHSSARQAIIARLETPQRPAKRTDYGQSAQSRQLSFTMVDYGAGPLTATLAMAIVLADVVKHPFDKEKVKASNSQRSPHLRLKSIVVESCDEIFAAGESLLDELREHLFECGIEVEVVRASLRSAEHFGPTESDLVIAANSLNELSGATRRDLQKFIVRCMDHKSLVLIIEPGQDTHSKTMAAFRDTLLATRSDCSILGPCPHLQNCPLGPDSAKPDWCWFRIQWQPTNWVKALDERTGLRHSDLNYCYFLVGPKQRAGEPAPWGRVVSDRIRLDETPIPVRRRLLTYLKTNSPQRTLPFEDKVMLSGPLSKTLVCTRDGTLVGVYDKLETGPQRGESVPTKPKSVWIAPERTVARSGPTDALPKRKKQTHADSARKARPKKDSAGKLAAGSKRRSVGIKIKARADKT